MITPIHRSSSTPTVKFEVGDAVYLRRPYQLLDGEFYVVALLPTNTRGTIDRVVVSERYGMNQFFVRVRWPHIDVASVFSGKNINLFLESKTCLTGSTHE